VFSTGGILDALKGGDLELAARDCDGRADRRVEVDGWSRSQSAWDDFKHFFLDGWKSARLLFELNLNDAVAFFAQAWIKVLKLVNKNFHETFTSRPQGDGRDRRRVRRQGPRRGAADARRAAEGAGGRGPRRRGAKLIEKKRSAEEDRLNKKAGRLRRTAVGNEPGVDRRGGRIGEGPPGGSPS
jgi:hypothetical protein